MKAGANVEEDGDAAVGMEDFDNPSPLGDEEAVVPGMGHFGHLIEALPDGRGGEACRPLGGHGQKGPRGLVWAGGDGDPRNGISLR